MAKPDLKNMKRFLEEVRKKQEKPNLSQMLKEIKSLMEDMLALQYLDKMNELKELLSSQQKEQKPEDKITKIEKAKYLTRDGEHFQKALDQLKHLADSKGLDHLVLYRPTADLEYAACKTEGKLTYNTKALDNGKGMETLWYVTFEAADKRRTTKNPLIQAAIPVSAISGFEFPPNAEATAYDNPLDTKWAEIVEIKVEAGEYEILAEYKGEL